jgi:hypothetical protein
MHFIEQVFGVSPDGGTGLTEIALILVVVTAVVRNYSIQAVTAKLSRGRDV